MLPVAGHELEARDNSHSADSEAAPGASSSSGGTKMHTERFTKPGNAAVVRGLLKEHHRRSTARLKGVFQWV